MAWRPESASVTLCVPAHKLLAQDPAVVGIVVHQQDPHAAQCGRVVGLARASGSGASVTEK